MSAFEDELHETARRSAGFDDFGDPSYREGLRILLNAFDSDLKLTEIGWQVVYDSILGCLTGRLYAQKNWAAHPEVLKIPIHRPLVITGLPRTGTTALHRLMSVDPHFQGPEFWLSERPMIRPPRETWEAHSEYRACVARIEAALRRVPDLRKAHDSVSGEIEECALVLRQSFADPIWSIYGLPTYTRWLHLQSPRKSYHRYVDVLRLIGGREPLRRWLLKSPWHMAEIGTLLEVFPDACIVQTHRDPLKAIPSFCSLVHIAMREVEGESARSDSIGPRQCAYWRSALDRMQRACRKLPTEQVFHVDHRRFHLDPLGIVYAIYEYFGLALSQHTEQQMRAWIATNTAGKYGEHRYAPDSWGITPAEICDVFADYRAEHRFE